MDLKKRFDDHNKGLSKYTSLGIPWELVYYEAYASKVAVLVKLASIADNLEAQGFNSEADQVHQIFKSVADAE
jgi:hypothetical protein